MQNLTWLETAGAALGVMLAGWAIIKGFGSIMRPSITAFLVYLLDDKSKRWTEAAEQVNRNNNRLENLEATVINHANQLQSLAGFEQFMEATVRNQKSIGATLESINNILREQGKEVAQMRGYVQGLVEERRTHDRRSHNDPAYAGPERREHERRTPTHDDPHR